MDVPFDPLGEIDIPVAEREQRIIAPASDEVAGVKMCPALADQYRPGLDELSLKPLDTESFRP